MAGKMLLEEDYGKGKKKTTRGGVLCTARSSLPCSVGGESNEGLDTPQPSVSALPCLTAQAELLHQTGFSHPRLAKKHQKNNQTKNNQRYQSWKDSYIYIFYTHTMWRPTISVSIPGCALEGPLKAHPFLLLPSWKPSFQKIRGFFVWVRSFNLLLPNHFTAL